MRFNWGAFWFMILSVLGVFAVVIGIAILGKLAGVWAIHVAMGLMVLLAAVFAGFTL